jgi:hypothetical protein
MFSNLYQLVKENAVNVISENALIPTKYKEAAINDASGTIVDVLKGQLDTGKLKDVVCFFQTSSTENNSLITLITKKYANRLNRYYNIDMDESNHIANKLIPAVLKKFVSSAKKTETKEDGMFPILNWLSGYTINFESLLLKMNTLQFA